MVVDDNRDAANTLATLLQSGGHDVTVAYSPHDALQRFQHEKPAVLFIDIGLPDIDGCEVARRLRAMPGGRGLKLVALTGYGQPADQARSREAGFDCHLIKPANPSEVLRLVAGLA